MSATVELPELVEIDVHPDQEQLFIPPRWLSSLEVCERADVSYRQLDYWCRTDLLCPMVPAAGSGTQRAFDESEVAVARAVKVLLPFYDRRSEGRAWDQHGQWSRDPELLAILERVRQGDRTMIEVERGIWFDLDVLCRDPE